MELLKQLSRQAEQVEVTSLSDEKTTIEFTANQLKSSSVTETRGMAARVVRKGRLGFAAGQHGRRRHDEAERDRAPELLDIHSLILNQFDCKAYSGIE